MKYLNKFYFFKCDVYLIEDLKDLKLYGCNICKSLVNI